MTLIAAEWTHGVRDGMQDPAPCRKGAIAIQSTYLLFGRFTEARHWLRQATPCSEAFGELCPPGISMPNRARLPDQSGSKNPAWDGQPAAWLAA